MKITVSNFIFILIFTAFIGTSCSKNEELVGLKGTVVNVDNKPISLAKVELFKSSNDWLTGHNVVAIAQSDLIGEFEFQDVLEAGEYYIFIEKYDTSNWEIRDVEQGIYPKITIPENNNQKYVIDYNNMSLMANTRWELTNVHREYTKPGEIAVEWQSIWTGINNCRRDNSITFTKDLKMLISEGQTVCKGESFEIEGTFVPPIILGSNSCIKLPNTSQNVKEFEFSNWPEMEQVNAKMYLACNQSVGQLYIYYKGNDGLMVLEVYSRR